MSNIMSVGLDLITNCDQGEGRPLIIRPFLSQASLVYPGLVLGLLD